MVTLKNALKVLGTIGGLLALGMGLVSWLVPPAESDTLSIPYSFSIGQVADPSTVNANFAAIAAIVNGKIDNGNWDTSGPQLAYANVDLTGNIVGADFADNSITNAKVLDGTLVSEDLGLHIISKRTSSGACTATDVDLNPDDTWFTRATIASYSPLSVNSDLLIVYRGFYHASMSSPAGRYGGAEIGLLIKSIAQDCDAVVGTVSSGSGTNTEHDMVQLVCTLAAPAGWPYDIVIRDRAAIFSGGGTTNDVDYLGAQMECDFSIFEFKR